MHALDWAVIAGYLLVMLVIGVWSHRQVSDAADFFTTGGRMPWWLAGISHHMSGYSAVIFVAYAGVAYDQGIVSYVVFLFPLAIGTGIGAFLFAPKWNRLRVHYDIASPLEYLARRFNVSTQQVLAWSGSTLKVFDVAAKWSAVALLMTEFAGIPLVWGIVTTAAVTLVYCTAGGLWADALTELGQFVIQAVAAFAMLAVVGTALSDIGLNYVTFWEALPEGHTSPTTSSYPGYFVLVYMLVKTFEYNGGMWNLAQRYIATRSTIEARRTALLSSALYLVWPLVLMLPMFAAPLLVDVANSEDAYARMALEFLPSGLLGLVLVGFFSHTMAMAASDATAISAVMTRDVLPKISHRAARFTDRQGLLAGRVLTVVFVFLSVVIAVNAEALGGVLGIILTWVGALIGPISIPLMLGMLRPFRHIGPTAALTSWAAGLITYGLTKYAWSMSEAITVASPVLVSMLVFVAVGAIRRDAPPAATEICDALAGRTRRSPENTPEKGPPVST
ncbi:Na+/proline symporter [Saccharopolyspora lacisalsi]|uniref:Na+/proline symporter n=1 Tax=Halosaccharopolyspora lacisalsi TaxID=1000566 RepID=A0A839DSK5_9PSEU|nr:sodium:solute symporter family protein [Halosaccharopolyspora lacisalsi]MBA8823729.1 Na+/proline symporter [Halosaccharopolyspora lacisalsi]